MLKLTVAQLLQNFFVPYGTQGLITVFTRYRNWTLNSGLSVAVKVSSSETFHDYNACISHVSHACYIRQQHHPCFDQFNIWRWSENIAHETVICRNPYNSSNLNSRNARQFGYKNTFCQHFCPPSPPKKVVSSIFVKPNMLKCWYINDLSSLFFCLL